MQQVKAALMGRTQPPPRSLHKGPLMHTISPQAEKGLVFFIHLLLVKKAFLMLEEDPICLSRGRMRWENKAEVVAEGVEFLR